MTIAYTWQSDSLDVFPTYQTVTAAVESMHWRITADDGIVKGDQAQVQAYIEACLAVKAKYPKPA